MKFAKKFVFISIIFYSIQLYALPFSVVPNTTLPTLVFPGVTIPAPASYIITNTSHFNTLGNIIKWLPANTAVNPTGTTCLPTSGFNLAPGQSCTLNLNVTGSINRNNSNSNQHLMVCRSDKITCTGPSPGNSLNVITVSDWMKQLSAKGYNPKQGNMFLLTDTSCAIFISIFGSCFGQNPASPYIIPQPPIEQSYVDPYYGVPLESTGPDGPTEMFFRLGDTDAMMVIVSYPPKAAYFGYQSYVATSAMSNYNGTPTPPPPLQRHISPDPARYGIAGSIGQDVNSIIVENQYGAPWSGRVVVYITTANTNLANALIYEATRAGINRNSIFIEPIGLNVVTGNGSQADDMLTLMRYAVPQTSLGQTWLNAYNSNVLVYKVSAPTITVTRYPTNQYLPHRINNSELSLSTARLQLVSLLQTYLATAQGASASFRPVIPTTVVNSNGVPVAGLVGSFCIFYGTNCEADNQDTSTYASMILKNLELSETAFIVGINHSVLNINNNHYLSVDIYNSLVNQGVASMSQTNPTATGFNSGILTGSAQQVLTDLGIAIPPGDTELINNISNLYVTFIARDCNNSTIISANAYCINLQGNSLIPAGDPISIVERSYVLPGKTTGGNLDYMLYPIIVAADTDFYT